MLVIWSKLHCSWPWQFTWFEARTYCTSSTDPANLNISSVHDPVDYTSLNQRLVRQVLETGMNESRWQFGTKNAWTCNASRSCFSCLRQFTGHLVEIFKNGVNSDGTELKMSMQLTVLSMILPTNSSPPHQNTGLESLLWSWKTATVSGWQGLIVKISMGSFAKVL